MMAKHQLARLLQDSGWSVELEKAFPSLGRGRRADIYAEQRRSPVRMQRVVLEVQNSHIDLEEIEARNKDYRSAYIKPLWIPTINNDIRLHSIGSDERWRRYAFAISKELGMVPSFFTDAFKIQPWQRYLLEENQFRGLAWFTRLGGLYHVRFRPHYRRASLVSAFCEPVGVGAALDLSFSDFEQSQYDEYFYGHVAQALATRPVFNATIRSVHPQTPRPPAIDHVLAWPFQSLQAA